MCLCVSVCVSVHCLHRVSVPAAPVLQVCLKGNVQWFVFEFSFVFVRWQQVGIKHV